MLAPFVPHICEELWERLGNEPSIFRRGWPEFDEAAARAEEIDLPVQVNGKLRDKLTVARDEAEDAIRERVMALEGVKRHIEGKQVRQIVIVPNRISQRHREMTQRSACRKTVSFRGASPWRRGIPIARSSTFSR